MQIFDAREDLKQWKRGTRPRSWKQHFENIRHGTSSKKSVKREFSGRFSEGHRDDPEKTRVANCDIQRFAWFLLSCYVGPTWHVGLWIYSPYRGWSPRSWTAHFGSQPLYNVIGLTWADKIPLTPNIVRQAREDAQTHLWKRRSQRTVTHLEMLSLWPIICSRSCGISRLSGTIRQSSSRGATWTSSIGLF